MRRLRFGLGDLPHAYGEGSDFVIHPGIIYDVASLWLGFEAKVLPTENVPINYGFRAEDVPLQRGTLVIPIEDLTRHLAESPVISP